MDARAELIFGTMADVFGAMFAATFGTHPLMWSLLLFSVVALALAAMDFADTRGLRAALWLCLGSCLFAVAVAIWPVQTWANTQDNRPHSVHDRFGQ